MTSPRPTFLPFAWPDTDEAEVTEIADAVRPGWVLHQAQPGVQVLTDLLQFGQHPGRWQPRFTGMRSSPHT